MAKVKFIGADPRDVPLPERPAGEGLRVAHGDVVEVDDAHAKSLARQSDVWELVKDKADAKPDAPKPAKDKE